MVPRREGSLRGPRSRRLALWAGLAVGWVLPTVGCQVEYAGMTLPSGKYFYDDIQYFPPGPEMPWANTQAATQRARMRAQGLEVPSAEPVGPIGAPPPAAGALEPSQNVPNMPTNVNVLQRPAAEIPPPAPAPGAPAPVPSGAARPAQAPGATQPPDVNIGNPPGQP